MIERQEASPLIVSYVSPKEYSRILAFSHLLDTSVAIEKKIDAGETDLKLVQPIKENGNTKQQTVMDLDRNFVSLLHRMAFTMYADDLRHNPRLKESADGIVARHRRMVQQDIPSVAQVQDIWNRP